MEPMNIRLGYAFSLIFVALPHFSFALPQTPSLVTGEGTYSVEENHLLINQHSQFMLSQFDQFNIAQNETVTFNQPNLQAIAVAQVMGGDMTHIYGQLSANGQLFLVSPGGLVVHEGASIEAGGLFLGAGNLIDSTQDEFLVGAGSSFSNYGHIKTLHGGISIFANQFSNAGELVSAGGLNVTSADSVFVQFDGDLFAMEVQANALDGLIANSGLMQSNGGNINIQAQVREQFNETVIHNSGEISATGAWQEGGEIYLGVNEGDVQNDGLIQITNELDNQSSSVLVEAQRIAHTGEINVSGLGDSDGGRIELLAQNTVDVRADSYLKANGGINGDGGFIKVFSPQSALFRSDASIEAQGGLLGGDGGFVDVSGWEYIEINGRVSTLALNGINGQFLIDPYNVTISAGATNNDAFAANTYTPFSNGAAINVTELQNNLKLGNVTVVTTGAGAENGDISVSVAINLDGTNGNTLELIADGSILLNGSITDGTPATADATNVTLQALNGTITAGVNTVQTGGGALQLKTNGNITLGAGGNLDLTKFDSEGGSLSVESTAGTLTLLSDIDLDGYSGSSINLKSNGNLNLNFDIKDFIPATAGFVNLGFTSSAGSVLLAGGKVVNSGGGDITIEAASDITVGIGGYVDLDNFNSAGGSLRVESLTGSLSLLNDLNLDGRSGSVLSLWAATDLNLNFNVVDSAVASTDSVALSFRADNDINIASGKGVNSYGAPISFVAGNDLNITNASTGGGTLYVTAINVNDAGDIGSGYDINAGGGVVSINYFGDVGGSSTATALEINDSIIDLSFYGSNQNFFVSAAGAQDLTIRDVDYNGTTTFNFNGSHTGTGSFNFSGDFSDSNDSGDVATINVNTTGVASHINVASSASLRTRGGDLTFITADTTSNITIGSSAVVRSQGGDVTYNSGGDIGITYTKSDGGDINLTAQNIYDNGNVRSDIVADGGAVNIIASGNVGGTSSSTGLEIENATINYTPTGTTQNLYLNASSTNSLTFNGIDYNGLGTFNFGVVHSGGGDVIIDGIIDDSNTGTVDTATFNIQTTSATGDFLISSNNSIRSRGGDITINVLGDASLSKLWSDGGAISITADDIIDSGTTNTDINASGNLVTLNASGNIGGTAYTSAIEINDAILDITTSGANQNVYIINDGTAGLTINDVDYNGTGTFDFNVRTTSTGDLTITGQVTDSVAGGDVATINFETQNAASDIVLDNATVRSYGGDITYNSAATLGVTNTQTDGGALTITATDVYDNGGGVDINTQGGLVTFNVSGDVGVSGVNGNLEVQDSIITGTVGAVNATWDIKSVAASSFLTLSDIDFNNANGFTLNALANGGALNVTGVISDSDSVGDSATITLETSLAGSDIIMSNGAGIYSNGGVITYNSADEIALAETLSNGGAINIAAVGNVYDNNGALNNIDAGGGVVSFNVNQNIGGTDFTQAIEIVDSIVDVIADSTNINVYLTNDDLSKSITIRDVNYNGGNGLNFNVGASNGGDIVISGDLYDSDLASVESATFHFETTSMNGDITINNGATIRSGNSGVTTLDSAGDLYLTGLLAGASTININVGNNIIDNGNITADIESSGVVNIVSGGSVGKLAANGPLEVSGGTYNLTMWTGDWDLLALADINLNNIEINGANGAQLQVISNRDISLTGLMTDSAGADDKIELVLGVSAPGFIIFPDAGYSLLGDLKFIGGTNGVKDATDERIQLTADSIISTGNNFLGNGAQIVWDLSVDTLDINDATGTKSFEFYNDKDLTLSDLDGDGEFLLGKDFKISVNGNLTVPNQAMNDVDEQLWLIANDMDDPDADNIISINDSADAGSDFNLILDLTGANDVRVNTNASLIDGSVAAGGVLRVHPTLIADFSQDLNADGSLMNGQGDIFIESSADVVLANGGLQTAGNLSIIADDVYDSDKQLSLSANDLYFSVLSPTSIYTIDLTAQRFDADVAADLTLNTSTDLELADVDADGFTLENIQNFKLNSTASLLLPATGISTANSIWLNAVDVSDGDYDLTFTTADLYLATTVSNTAYQLNGGFNRFDYDFSGAQTDIAINVTGSLDLATYDGASDGSTLEGGRHFTVSTSGDLLLKDGGVSSGGDINIQVAGELTTFSNQAIILSGANVSMQVAGATNPIEANLTASGNLLVDINSALVVQGGTLNVAGDTSVKADDVRSDTNRIITLTGNRANINFVNQLADSTINAQVNELDAQGGAGLLVNSLADLTLLDINGDAIALTGFQNIEVEVNGVLTLLDTGLQTTGDLTIVADRVEDSDSIVQLSADRLFVDYQSPVANVAYGINGAFNEFNAAINGDLNLTVTGDVAINDWSGTGQLLNSLQDFSVVSSGTVSIPSTGLSAASMLWIEAVDLTDGSSELNLNASDVYFNLSKADKTFVINTTATNLDGNLTGTHGQLVVNGANDLAIADVNGDGNSLMINDGYGYFDVKGALQVNGNIQVLDAQNDGTVGGWLYLAYEGQADIGNTTATSIIADGSVEASISVINPDANSQIFIQQTGALSASNGLTIGAVGATLQSIGGDLVIDVTNGTNTISSAGDISLAAGSSLTARNAQADTLADLQFESLTSAGTVKIGGGKTVRINGYAAVEPDAPVEPEVPEDVLTDINDAVSDVINDSVGESDQIVAEDLQDETIGAVESTPNVNLALNEMFSGCRESNEQESRCKVKEEISRFLGRFLIGGSMPKSK